MILVLFYPPPHIFSTSQSLSIRRAQDRAGHAVAGLPGAALRADEGEDGASRTWRQDAAAFLLHRLDAHH